MINWTAMTKIPFIFFSDMNANLEEGWISFIDCRPRYMFHSLIDPNQQYAKMTIRMDPNDTGNLPVLIIEDDKLPDGSLRLPMYVEFWPQRIE